MSIYVCNVISLKGRINNYYVRYELINQAK